MNRVLEYLTRFWEWLMSKAVIIIIILACLLYVMASNATLKHERAKAQEEFQCETSCFPQQNEYIYNGDVGSCWCYVDKQTMKKYNQETQ